MAKEYIEREAIIAEYDRQHKGPPGGARKIMETFPAADVRPVEKCKWENLVRRGFASVEATCSACGKTLVYKSWWHFCPNCGNPVAREQENE